MGQEKKKKTPGGAGSGPLPPFFFRFPGILLLVVGVVLLIYFPILFANVGKLDEYNILIVNIDFLRDFGNLKKALLLNPFFHEGGDFYRPVQNFSFMVDAHLSGEQGWGYFLTNILLHSATGVLIYYLIIQLGGEKRVALVMTLLFAAHPLFVQTVAWAPSRGDMLISFFGVLSFLAFVRFVRGGKAYWLVIHILAYALALFSKESAVLVPLICFGWYLFLGKEHKVRLLAFSVPVICYAVILGSFFYIRDNLVHIDVPQSQVGLTAVFHNIRIFPELFFRLFIPVGLAPMPAFHTGYTIGGFLVLLGLGYLVYRSEPRSWKRFLFGLAWYVLFLSPVLVYVNKYGSASCDYMEHRAYLPAIGIVLFLAAWLSERFSQPVIRKAVVILAFLIPVAGIYSRVYVGNYKTTAAYYDHAVKTNPSSAVAVYCRGTVRMYEQSDFPGAMRDFDQAIRLYPEYPQAYLNKGFCLEQTGDPMGAARCYKAAAGINPLSYEPHFALALLYSSAGLKKEAIPEFDTVLRLYPGFFEGYFRRGLVNLDLRDIAAAHSDFSKAIEIRPSSPEAYMYRGVASFQASEYRMAYEDFSEAIRLKPDYSDAWLNRGILNFQVREFQAALDDLSQAITYNGQSAEAWLNRGRVYYWLKQDKPAFSDWQTSAGLGNIEAKSLLETVYHNTSPL